MTPQHLTKIIRNCALVIFLNITQLCAMEAAPEEYTLAEEHEAVINYLKVAKKAFSILAILERMSLPEESMSWKDFNLLMDKELNSHNRNLIRQGVTAKSMLPQKIVAELTRFTHPPTPYPSGILSPLQLSETLKLEVASCMLSLTTTFNYLKTLYPELIWETFEEFWNDGKLDEDGQNLVEETQ